VSHVVVAAGKRLGEALRTIEEYLKTLDRSVPAVVEAIAYRFYDIEQQIALTLRPLERFAKVRLYVLITESICRAPWLEVAEAAIQAARDCLQLRGERRWKARNCSRGRAARALCTQHG
jgi:hypothetical protein